MIANYHNHTYRCKHAFGSEEEYIKRAIDGGTEIFGFSDHAPFHFPDGYISPSRMDISEIDEYFDTLLTLRQRYREYIDIKIGFEIEYYPRLWDKAMETYSKYPLDYLILGEHHIGNESISSVNAFAPTEEESVLSAFVDHCINAVRTGRITYIAHPDNINFTGDDDVYVKEMTRLVLECVRLDIPLEINLLGVREGRHYPRELFWQTAGRLGAKAVLGFDSHKPSHVANADEIAKGTDFASEHGLILLDRLELKKPTP